MVFFKCLLAAALPLLHDADTAVELTLGVVVVDVRVGVAAAHVGRGHRGEGARIVGATVLKEDVCALLAASSPSVGQRCLAASVATLHIHTVLWEETKGCRRSIGEIYIPFRLGISKKLKCIYYEY